MILKIILIYIAIVICSIGESLITLYRITEVAKTINDNYKYKSVLINLFTSVKLKVELCLLCLIPIFNVILMILFTVLNFSDDTVFQEFIIKVDDILKEVKDK